MDAELDKRLKAMEKKETEMVWHNRIQTFALILSFLGVVSVIQHYTKKK